MREHEARVPPKYLTPREAMTYKHVRDEITRRQAALTELNIRFPGERKKSSPKRDPEFIRLRQEIMSGNYDVFNQEKEGV